MKHVTTVLGQKYCVYTDLDCEVRNAVTGRLLLVALPGQPNVFPAPCAAVTLSAEDADCVLFECAPADFILFGWGDKLPAGYTRASHLDNMGSAAYIYGVAERIKNPFEIELVFYGGGVEWTENNFCGQRGGGDNPSWWFYSYDRPGHIGFRSVPASTNKFKTVDVYLTGATRKLVATFKNGVYTAPDGSTYEYGRIRESSDPMTMQIFYEWETNKGCKISSVYVKTGEKVHKYVAALDPTGTPCMFDLVSKQPFYNVGSGQFIVGVKDSAQLRTVLRKLPDLSGQDMGTLTLSIPAESYTPEMQELLATTETQKNWELTIQERASEVATYSLRRVRKVVWVRREPDKNGSYVDKDGRRWQVEWCSAIYSPLGNDPTLHGYEPFDSVEQAVEAWGLVPYVDPNAEPETEPETLT